MPVPETTIIIENPDQLEQAAQLILKYADGHRVFAIYGEMGAGKTTLIQSICKQLGIKDTVTSPTFSLVNEYHFDGGERVYHFDFYRIKNIQEAYDIGYEEYFFSGNYCFIEWPEKIEPLLDFPCYKIRINTENKKRIVTLHS